MQKQFKSLDGAFRWTIESILNCGEAIAPRGIPTRELRVVGFSIEDPRKRYVSLPARRWSLSYAIGEFCWHARGSNESDEIGHYSSRWRMMSDRNGKIVGSCYGAKIFRASKDSASQWNATKRILKEDPASRRAVLIFAEPPTDSPAGRSDVSCATSLQFSVRGTKLEALASMRSNDAILGLPYDVFLFTMLQEMMARELGLEMGTYHHIVGSMHIYHSDISWAEEIACALPTVEDAMPEMGDLSGLQLLLQGEQRIRNELEMNSFGSSPHRYWQDLLDVLVYRDAARKDSNTHIDNIVHHPLYRKLGILRSQ